LRASGAFFELREVLPLAVEQWNEIDLRVLDVLVDHAEGDPRAPFVGTEPPTTEAGLDRFALFSAHVSKRGLDPIEIAIDPATEDGSRVGFHVPPTGRPLSGAERARVRAEASFTLDVSGERLSVTGGTDAGHTIALASGKYRATVHALGADDGTELVIVLAPASGTAPKHAEPPYLGV
jgi:hypothetical protein